MSIYEGKKILVTGGTGMIGRPLVTSLIEQGAEVSIASLDSPTRAHPKARFHQVDLCDINNCLDVCSGQDMVFHLAGIKGSPKMTSQKPASFFVPTISFNTNMMSAAFRTGVKKYLFTSSVGVYSPAEVFKEDDVWSTFPSENDRFAGWAKRMGELQADAFRIEHGWNGVSIVRPANVYGPYDNFDPENCMVVPSLIKRAMDGENPLTVWGDGSSIRDFIYASDVADGMLKVVESGETRPVNLGSGTGLSIKKLVEVIVAQMKNPPEVVWDTSKPSGDKMRILDTTRAKSLGINPHVSIEQGVKLTMDWYANNKAITENRFNVFTQNKTSEVQL